MARTKILDKIRSALNQPAYVPALISDRKSVYRREPDDLVALFIHEFNALDGCLIRCKNKNDLSAKLSELARLRQWKRVLNRSDCLEQSVNEMSLNFLVNEFTEKSGSAVDAGITDCTYLIARTGTVAMTSAQKSGRVFPVEVPVHIIIATIGQLVYDLNDVLVAFKDENPERRASSLFFISGPSRSADIEKTLVLGVHGPLEVYLMLLDK